MLRSICTLRCATSLINGPIPRQLSLAVLRSLNLVSQSLPLLSSSSPVSRIESLSSHYFRRRRAHVVIVKLAGTSPSRCRRVHQRVGGLGPIELNPDPRVCEVVHGTCLEDLSAAPTQTLMPCEGVTHIVSTARLYTAVGCQRVKIG